MQLTKVSEELGLVDYAAALQQRHEAARAPGARKERGQVFTPPGVCRFMAGLFTQIPDDFKLLDAGAGAGSLAAAVCERVLTLRSPRNVEIVLYETDATLLPLLEENMRNCRQALSAAGHDLRYTIHDADFILETRGRPEEFGAAIMNPPYFKIRAGSAHALAMGQTFRSQPNIYTLFMARAAQLLRPDGELVAVTPRSFCNGLYFRGFRRWFFERMTLGHVHLFECRRSTFDNVLQESIITHTRRSGVALPSTKITSSVGRDIPVKPEELGLPTGRILDDTAGDRVLRIPTSAEDVAISNVVESWPDRFIELGLRISTGPVVLFRAKEFLLSKPDGKDTAPLIEPHNVKPFETVWPVEKRGKPTAFRVCPASLKHLVPARNYVLLRRFSAKEERRRLTASCFFKAGETRPYLALENHLNYVYHASRDLTEAKVYGLAALFNSALIDRYFRMISGNTQVNATEIRSINFPSLDKVAVIGARVKALDDYQPEKVERVVVEVLGINGRLASYSEGSRELSKTGQVATILAATGLPKERQNESLAPTLQAVASLGPDGHQAHVESPIPRTVGIMDCMREQYVPSHPISPTDYGYNRSNAIDEVPVVGGPCAPEALLMLE